MIDHSNCLCCFFKKLPKGTFVSVQFSELNELRFIFIDIKDDCVTGITTEGCITLSCKNIISVTCITECTPVIILDSTIINCTGVITGRILCGGLPIQNTTVNLSTTSNDIVIQTPVTTNSFGEFTSVITVNPGTQSTNVEITAQASIKGLLISDSVFITVQCIECVSPTLTLMGPENIECSGTLTGTLTCDGEPLSNVPITITVSPVNPNITIFPNPTQTDMAGNYSADIIISPPVSGTFTFTATATVGTQVLTESVMININCEAVPACPCKFQLISSSQPGAQITITQGTNIENLTGSMNITVIQCGTNPNQPCNPAIDNFNFTFNASNGNTYQFTQGRRTEIVSCDNPIILEGTIQGNIDGGPKETFMVVITATLNANNTITWDIVATDGINTTFETTVPFIATAQNSFIGSCT